MNGGNMTVSCLNGAFCCLDEDEAAQRESLINKDINRAIKAEKERRLDEHRCLILGCGEAGKTTFIKQMHIIHKQGFPEESRREQKLRIAENIIQAITVLLRNMTFVEENEFFADAAAAEAYERIDAMTDQSPQSVFERADDFKLLWENAIVQAVYSRRNQFQIVECAAYFLSKVHLVMAENYLPSDNDILQVRVMTKGIVEHPFEIAQKDRKRTLILIDVGGQRSERRKWIHFFEDVLVLIFLTAVSEYDQVCAEDSATNRMKESVNLFSTILNYRWFSQTAVILFLNKLDLLEEKIRRGTSPFSKYFPEFPKENDGDINAVKTFIKNMFLAQRPKEKEGDISAHFTVATNTDNIKIIDATVRTIIMTEILKNAGIH